MATSIQVWRVVLDAAPHLISWAAPRYRLPSDALLLVFAGLAVADLQATIRHLQSRCVSSS